MVTNIYVYSNSVEDSINGSKPQHEKLGDECEGDSTIQYWEECNPRYGVPRQYSPTARAGQPLA